MAEPRGRIGTAALRLTRFSFVAVVCALVGAPIAGAHHSINFALVGTLGTNGWYRSNVTIQWQMSHPGDITASSGCEPGTQVTSEGVSQRTCTATASDHSVSLTVTVRVDKTLPTVPDGTPARAPDSNGFYNHSVGVSFTATDAVSGLASCVGSSYSGPDSATASAPGSCTDVAGNTSSGAFALAYDATRPSASGSFARSPNGNGWFNAPVAWNVTGSDATSGLAAGACVGATYGGPDGSGRSVSGSCTDRAGNPSLPATQTLNYDATVPVVTSSAPARAPDRNGWYNQPVALSVSGSDATSGIAAGGCGGPAYSGPDGSARTISGACTDRAGNTSGSVSATIRYDATKPSATGSLARGPDANGWYNHAVALSLSGSDPTSGIDSCTGGYSGPDGTSRTASGTCTDMAGNVSDPVTATLNYDATRPSASGSLARAPNGNGWFNAPVALNVTGSDATSGLAAGACVGASYNGPDGSGRSVSGSCTDRAGNTSLPATQTLNYDATVPVVTSSAPARPPNAAGWYNQPVALSVSGSDATSGIAAGGCGGPAYSGPDGSARVISGSCTDRAGNTSASVSATIRYDATKPSATGSLARGPDANGWYNHAVALSLSGSDATSGIDSCAGGYSGPDGTSRTASGTCTDVAGNMSDPVTAMLNYDATRPLASASWARSPNANGWFNAPVALNVTGSDATSGLAAGACVGATYSGPDGSGRSLSGSCTDRAGNTSLPATQTLNYDTTPPSASGSLARPPDANGWYNSPVALGVTGGDATSGIASCTGPSYSGPDGPAQTINGSCTDRAGNTNSSVSATLKYDATRPTASGSLVRGPDVGGWYNHPVAFALNGTDATSGIASCAGGYGGPDGTSRTATGNCTDVAGNPSGPVTATINYDATAPSTTSSLARAPDANGWYNQPVSLNVSGSDATSGLASCSGATYSGPDGAAAQVAGACTDQAGNSVPAAATLRYDATPPSTSAVPDRGDGGWYREPVTVAFAGADAASGVFACTAPATYSGPDTGGATLAGSCADAAGNSSSAAFTVKFDSSAPSVSVGLARGPDSNGWYNRPVGVVASGSDSASGIASCSAPSYSGPDTAGVSLSASCSDNAGNVSGAASVSLKYDATAPTLATSADRQPDGGGWYRRPLTVSFAGADATSGIASCTAPVRYTGPDRVNGSAAGTCSDAAGNAADGAYVFRYDGTSPSLSRAAVRLANGVATITWVRSADVASLQIVRTPGRNGARSTVVYRGAGRSFADRTVRNGVKYAYELVAADAAGNLARASVTATPRPALYRPAAGATVQAPVTLAWEPVTGARFYNFQLRRDGVKVMSTWPRSATLTLPRTWRFAGKRYALEPGVYTWWVWAARGTLAQPQYGRPLGSSRFVVKGR